MYRWQEPDLPVIYKYTFFLKQKFLDFLVMDFIVLSSNCGNNF